MDLNRKSTFRSGILSKDNVVFTHFVGVPVSAGLVGVQDRRNTSKHLKNEGLSIHEIKLLDRVFDSRSDQLVGLMRRVELKQRRHYQQIAIGREYIFEVVRGVDVSCDDVAKNTRILAVEYHRTVEYVQKQMDVNRVSEVTGHSFEHSRDEPNPHKLVHDVET